MLKSMLSLLTGEQMLRINKRNNRPSALTSGRRLAAACKVNGYILPTNVMDPLQEQEVPELLLSVENFSRDVIRNANF